MIAAQSRAIALSPTPASPMKIVCSRSIFAFVLTAAMLAQSGRVRASPDHSKVPGVVIAHSPKSSQIYLGSAGICVLPDGTYLAKHDEFGPGSTEKTRAITRVYRSFDKGKSWEQISRVEDLFWASIFPHRGAVYLMGTSATHRHGHAVIRRSTDGGRSWTEARDGNSGRLFPDISYHTAPTPVIIHGGRIWRAMEDEKGGEKWGTMFRAFMLSAPEDADLLKASNWTASNALPHDKSWLDGKFGGWLEGNAVVTPAGDIVDILRVDYRDLPEKAAIVRFSGDGRTATFDASRDFIDFPGGCKKFVIRWDAPSKRYWTLSNATLPAYAGGNIERIRNTQVLMSSADLHTWTPHEVVLHHPDVNTHGFQYLDWLVDGEDLLIVSRTAYDDGMGGAMNQHNSNYLTFHRLKQFRKAVNSRVEVATHR